MNHPDTEFNSSQVDLNQSMVRETAVFGFVALFPILVTK